MTKRTDSIVSEAIQRKKIIAKAQNKKLRLRKTPRPKSVRPIERQYFKELMKVVTAMKESVDRYVVPLIPSVIAQAQLVKPKLDKKDRYKSDEWDDQVTESVNISRIMYDKEYTQEQLEFIARSQAEKINKANFEYFSNMTKAVIGIDIQTFEPWLRTSIKSFVKENVSLITTIESDYFEKVEQTILRGVTQGKLGKDIAADIKKRFDVSANRAKLIARDQVSKFNGELNKTRQTAVGIEKYEWQTVGDSRVRPEHAARDGKIFKWSEPPYDGNPGQPIQCRCVAIAVFEE